MGNVRPKSIKRAGLGGSTAAVIFPGLVAGHQETNNANRKIIAENPIIRNHAAYTARLGLTEIPAKPAQASIEINTVKKNLGEITARNIKEGLTKQANIVEPQIQALEKHIQDFSNVLKELGEKQIAILKKEKDQNTQASAEKLKTLEKGLDEVQTRIKHVIKEKETVESSAHKLFLSTLDALPEAQRLAVRSATPTASTQGPANK